MMTQGLVRILLGAAIGLFCFNAAPVQATQLEKSNKQLAAIKEQIRQQALALEEKMDEKSSLENTFKRAELKVSELVIALKQTQNKLDGLNKKVKKLTQEQNKLKEQQKQQQKILSEMVRIAYLNGKHDYTKLLLNQNDPAQLERLITYYRKLNGARIEQLDEIEYTLSRLNEIAVDLAEKKQQLFELKEQQKQERSQLVSRQNDRKNALAKLNKRIATDANKLEQLQADQQRLALAIEKAQQNAVPRPEDLAGLFKLKKKLSWPAKGRISKRFGQRRQGSMRWKGVMIDGNLGKPVNAIADGIVLYTDWLKGFGWVTVIDHGKGYMSLYGHNQALLKQAGDFVEKGEPVALLGQSGGKSSPGLYFEIRYKGKTVDPARWCK
ncbi:murein hydrolase activator EnvC family protein [Psychrosphaera haliotis]|uniref:Peptidoglycan DD-metalloendopeptidase family protein n=1 Tax=Psychrosphaera haliotis TaxID=555083 RepID=A0A6N8FAM8_9GAMM|nr:peptidoglycan DD-metalloendopeptidase family protein [Psychrosphaera haliotis]MDB2374251.1 peptidoglycan DD-metalloendopeptidase family protein [Psychrosphaera haliotis]MUH73184.1 peptidoglycan DD-metalloendopeptidase family protein [Psychrosphaera haliotis]